MIVGGIQQPIITNGIYQYSKSVVVGKERVDTVVGKFKDKQITVYSQYTDNNLITKLYYIQDKFLNMIKFKFLKIDGNKKTLLLKGEKD